MKPRFRMYQRGSNGRYYLEDNTTGKQESLSTSNRQGALRLFNARNEACYQPGLNAQMAKAYLAASDPEIGRRTWQFVIDKLTGGKAGRAKTTIDRYLSAYQEKPFDGLRNILLIETRPETILNVLQGGTMSTNVFMQRLHSFALTMGWLPWPVLAYKHWPQRRYKRRRAITALEAQRIVAAEKNAEWKAFLELIWHLGAAQIDMAALTHKNIDWDNNVISYVRKKTGTQAIQKFGPAMEAILRSRPSQGPLFPHYAKLRSADRATRFADRCKQLGIQGVSLHSYRYAWAERARKAGYPQRFAQEALGHTSSAIHRAYAKGATVTIPPLEEYEEGTERKPVIPFPTARSVA